MQRQKWSDEQKAEALRIVAEVGIGEASRRTGIPTGTVASWASRTGVTTPNPGATAKLVEANAVAWAERKVELAHRLVGDLERLRQQLFAPCVERRVVSLYRGPAEGSTIEIVDVHRDQPTFAEQKAIMTTFAIGVDKVLLMLGEATERIETTAPPQRTPEVEAELAKVIQLREAS